MSFVAVDVIDFGLIVGIVNERPRHQSMNTENFIFSVFGQADHSVAVNVYMVLEYAGFAPVKTFYATENADLIKTIVADNVAPNFVRQIIQRKPTRTVP